MAETIAKRRCSAFYFLKDTFDSIPIPMANCLESESGSSKCCFEMLGVIDEKHGVCDIVFLPKFVQKLLC